VDDVARIVLDDDDSAAASPAPATVDLAAEAKHIKAFAASHRYKQDSRAEQERQLLLRISQELQRRFVPLAAVDIPQGISPLEKSVEQQSLRAALSQAEAIRDFGVKSLAHIHNSSLLKDQILRELKEVEDYVGLTYARILPGYEDEKSPKIYKSGEYL
jgi:hypothetical protein